MKSELLDMTINDAFDQAVRKHPYSRAIIHEDSFLTYEELDKKTDRIAAYLQQSGVKKGTVVSMMMCTNEDAMCIFYALMKTGAVIVPLNPQSGGDTLLYMLKLTEPELMIIGENIPVPEELLPTDYAQLNMRCVRAPKGLGDWQADASVSPTKTTDSKAPAVLVFTSGTTSRPKAVTLNQYALLNSARNLGALLETSPEDRFCAALPICHSFCISVTMLIPLLYGAATCIVGDHHTYSVLQVLERQRCTVLSGVPTMFHSIISKPDLNRYDLSALRIGFIGGAYCAPEQFKQIEEKLQMTLLPTLGQTECTGGFTCACASDSQEIRCRSVGRAMEHMTVTVQSRSGQILEPGQSGEICVRGYLLMNGYWKTAEKTREVIDENGWLHTGDVGRIDENGYIYLSGRMKNIIIRAGENIAPSEIEAVILEDRRIEACKVVGIPDEHYGEELCACILSDVITDAELEHLRERLAERLEEFKVPRYLLHFDEFPYTAIGKIHTEQIKKLAIERVRR